MPYRKIKSSGYETPPKGSTINWSHPITLGLRVCFVFNGFENGGREIIGGELIPFNGAGTYGPDVFGYGLKCKGADAGIIKTTPGNRFKLTGGDISMFWRGVTYSGISANGKFIGTSYDNADSPPYVGYELAVDSSGNLDLNWSSGGGFLHMGGGSAPPTGVEWDYAGTITNGAQKSYKNGILSVSSAQASTGPSYSATWAFGVGVYRNGISRDSKSTCRCTYVWDRVLSSKEIMQLHINPYCFINSPSRRRIISQVGGAVSSLFTPYFYREHIARMA